jgi:WhiB family redox-sensing transcriptional regulator
MNVVYLRAAAADADWRDAALCAQTDPDLWFPELGGTGSPARRICAACPVQAECLDAAISMVPLPQAGIWAGLGYQALRREAARRGRPIPCETCGEMFTLPNPDHPVIYCSSSCRRVRRRAQQAAWERRERKAAA